MILRNLNDGVVTISEDGVIQSFNPAAEHMFGYAASEVLGQNVRMLASGAEQDRHDFYLARYVATGDSRFVGTGPREVMARRKDGSNFPAELAVAETQVGASRMFIGVLRDLTRRKQAEFERARLEMRVRQAEKMEALGQLTGGIAHDFNNLLTIVLGNARLLERTFRDDPAACQKARAICAASKRGAELVHRLLAFSRRQQLEARRVDAVDLVRSMRKILSRTLGDHIEIRVVITERPNAAFVDPVQLENALLNLALNARDAMPKGGALTIEVRDAKFIEGEVHGGSELSPGDYVVIAVSDTGTGIRPEDLDHIFEPFYTTKEVGDGTGLGLSMVLGFVKQSNGHVDVDSTVGRGTTFRLFLPAASADTAHEALDPVVRGEYARGHETILVVEDQADVRAFAANFLQELGYRVIEAANGPAALHIVRERPDVDLLFTDMIMPGGMNGRELAEQVRLQIPGIKVLYTTGYSDEALTRIGSLHADAILLNKPYEDVDLAQKIREALHGAPEAPAAGRRGEGD
jgi:PAS domain S-box-containing protein